MANTDNSCDHLEVGDQIWKEFDVIFDLQKELQENTYGYKFNDMTMTRLVQFLLMNKHALEDEMSETMDAVGGIHDGIGPAAWKPWKKENQHTDSMCIRDLSKRDRQELLMEIVDQFHFFMNQVVSCGFTGSDLVNGYLAKRGENIRRKNEGY